MINEKYQIIKLLGSGGMGKVYLAMDIKNKQLVAIKMIKDKAFNNEIVLMPYLKHDMIPEVKEVIETEQKSFLVMEYIEGETLSELLTKIKVIPQVLVVEWAKQLIGVLAYLHNQNPPLIYGDLKPNNIMVTKTGQLKLIDFGTIQKLTNVDQFYAIGTKDYAAPEQFGRVGKPSVGIDVYGLGCTLYHLLTGQNPSQFQIGELTICEYNRYLSSQLEKVILKCTEFEVDKRYPNVIEVLVAINDYQGKQKRLRIRYFSLIIVMVISNLVVFLINVLLGISLMIVIRSYWKYKKVVFKKLKDNDVKQFETMVINEQFRLTLKLIKE